jgi:hypothetical protein
MEGISMDGQRFDRLTKGLATGVDRRRVLRGLAGTALGAVGLTRMGGGATLAQGNSDCAHFCNQALPPGPERGKCKSDAAHGTGLCYSCANPANVGMACDDDNVCTTDDVCQADGSCAGTPVEEGGACIGQEGFCLNHTCVEACDHSGDVCAGLSPCGSSDSGCDCFATPEGTTACVGQPRTCVGPICEHSSDCPAGSVCLLSCCGTGVCRSLCGVEAQVSLAAFDETGGSMVLP